MTLITGACALNSLVIKLCRHRSVRISKGIFTTGADEPITAAFQYEIDQDDVQKWF
jgi:hypothetical protein